MNVCPVTNTPGLNPGVAGKIGQPLCLMSPIGRKALGVKLDFTPPCTFAAAPHLLVIPRRLCRVLSIPSTFDSPTPASYLGFRLRRSRSARYREPRTSASAYGIGRSARYRRHGKLALAGRSVDQREEDELMVQWPKYTLEDYGFAWEHVPRAEYYL